MSADLGDLTLGADQPATVRMLVKEERCFVLCLLAINEEAEGCTCSRCKGELHGLASWLLDLPVDGTRRRVRPPADDPPALFDVQVPEPARAMS